MNPLTIEQAETLIRKNNWKLRILFDYSPFPVYIASLVDKSDFLLATGGHKQCEKSIIQAVSHALEKQEEFTCQTMT